MKEIVARNIAYLRKKQKWTQLELAEKMNFSDKAISKWERGESTPDVDSIFRLSKIFHVTVDYFFHDLDEKKDEFVDKRSQMFVKNILVMSLFCIAVLFISLAVFLLGFYSDPKNFDSYWMSFVWAIPVCSLVCDYFFSKRKLNIPIAQMVCTSTLLWSFLTAIFLQLFLAGYNFALCFLVGIPLQAAIIVMHFVRK